MSDPYKVLGVSHNASADEIKKAYRDLARKYHPDNYHDNPLADLAQEKMKEINEAYDTITKEREQGSSGYSYGGDSSSGAGAYSGAGKSYSGTFAQVRSAINSGDLSRAEQLLNSSSDRGAEWNYLMGSLYYRKGWLDEAERYFQTAVNMEPTNPEYRQALAYMQRGGSAYRYSQGGVGGGTDACDCCSSMLIADCCCEMMGGDLIRCC